MLYYFDETADQGFVDKVQDWTTYGVLAGIAFPESVKDSLETKLQQILSVQNISDYNKLHCTELFKDDQNQELREKMYSVLLGFNECLIIHEGRYGLGVKNAEKRLSDAVQQNKREVPEHIKVIPSKTRTRLYTSMLEGIIVKLEECAISEGEEEVQMFSDRLDGKMQEEAKATLKRLQSDTRKVTTRSFNTDTRVKTEQHYEVKITGNLATVNRVKNIEYLTKVTPISFAADFVCFELLRHFRRKIKESEEPINFHTEGIMKGFRLKDKVAFLGDNYLSDLIYK